MLRHLSPELPAAQTRDLLATINQPIEQLIHQSINSEKLPRSTEIAYYRHAKASVARNIYYRKKYSVPIFRISVGLCYKVQQCIGLGYHVTAQITIPQKQLCDELCACVTCEFMNAVYDNPSFTGTWHRQTNKQDIKYKSNRK